MSHEVDQIKQSIATAKLTIDNFTKLAKLMQDPIFKEIILEGFCKEQVVKSLEVANNMSYPENIRKAADEMAKAGVRLTLWFQNLEQRAQLADDDLKQAENQLAEVLNEGNVND